jgi:hypothetical protein
MQPSTNTSLPSTPSTPKIDREDSVQPSSSGRSQRSEGHAADSSGSIEVGGGFRIGQKVVMCGLSAKNAHFNGVS